MNLDEDGQKCRCSFRKRRHYLTTKTTFSEQNPAGQQLRKAAATTGALHMTISSLILVVIYLSVIAAAKVTEEVQSKSSRVQQPYNATTNSVSLPSEQTTVKLDCKPGEQRHFTYESSTRVWGSSQQQVRLRASLRLRCLEAPANGTLKYLVEILTLNPGFESPSHNKVFASEDPAKRAKSAYLRSDWERDARAEPVFEEVADAISVTATRVKRSVSGWFSKTWSSVKDFFGNIFTSSEKSSVSREQAFRESGLDIASQCKSNKHGAGKSGLPLDESIFDDLEPKYYIGASLDSPAGASKTHYEFDERYSDELDSDEDASLSFFDDPKVRNRRAIVDKEAEAHDRLIKLPFVLLQSPLGRIVDVRFGGEDRDVSVRNFKRHLCDLFATNLDPSKSQLSETSPVGQHATKYLLDSSTNSEAIRQTLVKASAGDPEQASTKPLVRVLAMMASQQQLDRDMSGLDEASASAGNQANDPSTGNQGDVSVLRTVNSSNSIHLNSRTIAPEIERMQVEVRQVQHISAGRLTGTAGQLSMSLLQAGAAAKGGQRRVRRSAEEVGDVADLLQVSTSFSVQLVPAARLDVQGQVTGSKARRVARSAGAESAGLSSKKENNGALDKQVKMEPTRADSAAPLNATSVKRRTREPLVSKPPSDQQELQQVLQDWRHLEQRLQLSSAGLAAESGGRQDGSQQRLELLRDQIQMRLNEEATRNKLRRTASLSRAAASTEPARSREAATGRSATNDLGLGLSQLVLDSGVTARRKGSIYTVIEEVLELESSLEEDKREGSVSRLLRDTARLDKLRSHCRSAVASLDEIRAQSRRLDLKMPFGLPDPPQEDDQRRAKSVAMLTNKNSKRLEQCQQVLRVLLRASERQAADLTLELVDECNKRLLAGSRDEELGWGPTSRYYRGLRQQFTELLAYLNRPSESFLDKLVMRLHYPKLGETQPKRSAQAEPQQEFTYVNKAAPEARYNRSLLREEDDFNNNEGAGSLIMIITSLASRPSISRSKRLEITDKLLASLKGSTCSAFSSPDLDILEAMTNFQEPLDEMAGKLVKLAQRCRHQDEYLVACVHGLSGQLHHQGVQKFLAEQLRSKNASCTLKSEILLALLAAMAADELKFSLAPKAEAGWPGVGQNQVDEALLELVGERSKRAADRRCLSQLADQYLSKKAARQVGGRTGRRAGRTRDRRSVANDNGFWDEAQCRRWQLPADGAAPSIQSSPSDLIDEIDDNSILQAVASSRQAGGRSAHGSSRNPKLMEREAEATNATAEATLIRRRHKCSASKTYGPRNAQATLCTDIVNDLVGPRDENKFLARFRLATNFLGNRIDVGRMYLWHQKRTTRAHVNILGKSLWDTSHGCQDKAPQHLLYMPLFDFNLWLVKISVGLKLQSEMGFFSNCDSRERNPAVAALEQPRTDSELGGQLELYPSVSLRASGEASAKFVVARAGMSLASQYGYQGNIRVSRQPESCMSIYSAHQPMNVTFSSWFQLFDNDCHYWGSRNKAEPHATKWRLSARKPTKWLEDECLASATVPANGSSPLTSRYVQSISP